MNLYCRHCGVQTTTREPVICRIDAERATSILAELHTWAEELHDTSTGITGLRHDPTDDRRTTRVDPPALIDWARRELAEQIDDARWLWLDILDDDGITTPIDWRRLTPWPKSPDFVRAMHHAEHAALRTLDPDELALREHREKIARRGVPTTARPPWQRLAVALGHTA